MRISDWSSDVCSSDLDALLGDRATPPPTAIDELPVIAHARGARDQGHAFAIVGYTREGFVIQNSWGDHWGRGGFAVLPYADRSEEHTSELQSLMRISYAVFCLKKKITYNKNPHITPILHK